MVRRLVVFAVSVSLMCIAASPATAQSRSGEYIIIDDDLPESTPPPPPVTPPKPRPPRLAPPVWKTLAPFKTLDEFNAYRVRARDVAKSWGWNWGFLRQRQNDGPLLAQEEARPCDPAIEECGNEEMSEVITTGYRASSKNTSITNNQEAGVDEGDIVKAFDRFLVVLLHGRLFSIDTGNAAGQLTLVDRVDAYEDPKTESWIDEILIFKNTLLVTGYSYETSSSNISLYKINADGHFDFLARYSIESNDYFDWQNYATRIVDGKLVIYTPFDLSEYPADQIMSLPRIRRFTVQAGFSQWQPLFNVQDVYKPIQPAVYPALHVMSVCPIDPGVELRCQSRGVIGPYQHEMYVAPDHAYLWLTSDTDEMEDAGNDACPRGQKTFNLRGVPSVAFRLNVSSGALAAVHTEGWPADQFSMEERPAHFWALVRRPPLECEVVDEAGEYYAPMALLRISNDEFSTRPSKMRSSDMNEVPLLKEFWGQQTRFADRQVLYGATCCQRDGANPEELIVVPLRDPSRTRKLTLRHGIDRLELFGDNAVVFGQQNEEALGVSSIKLDGRPHIVDTQLMPGIAESEGRSHAFNSVAGNDGSGIFGLPTYDNEAARDSGWRDVRTEVRFFTASRDLKLASADQLNGKPEDEVTEAGYECVVSCYDWYGNARPIFFRDRVFALIGAELIEGSVNGGRVAENARVNLTGAPAWKR
jgi:hypothetical protein